MLRSGPLFALTSVVFNLLLWSDAKAYRVGNTHTQPYNAQRVIASKEGPKIDKEKTPIIVICGGGPAGLLVSILLNNIGIKSTVVDQAIETDSWTTRSYTIILNDKGIGALKRAACFETALEVGSERSFTYLFNGTTGHMKSIHKNAPVFAFTRPYLVQCLESIASELIDVTIRKAGVTSVTNDEDDELGLIVHLEDGTNISATHVIGADGKWSNVRQSLPSFTATMVTCPSSAVHMVMNSIPKGWKANGMYIIEPTNDDCKFYIVASPLPNGCGLSISMIYYDQTLEKYPWLTPPIDMKNYTGSWEVDSSPTTLSAHLKRLFEEEMPAFYAALNNETFNTAVVRRRVTWLQMEAEEGKNVTYSTLGGRVTLIGDSAHAMTPSLGEGCNTALESAVKLVDAIIATMKEKEEASCTTSTMSLAFMRYGSSRPNECISLQKLSAARSNLKKET